YERMRLVRGALAEDGIDRGFPGTERVFIAADANAFHSRRKIGTHAARATLAAGLLRFRHQLFVAAGGHESSGVGVLSQSQALKETAARHRHGILLQLCGGRKTELRVNLTDFTPRLQRVSTKHQGLSLSTTVTDRGSCAILPRPASASPTRKTHF